MKVACSNCEVTHDWWFEFSNQDWTILERDETNDFEFLPICGEHRIFVDGSESDMVLKIS